MGGGSGTRVDHRHQRPAIDKSDPFSSLKRIDGPRRTSRTWQPAAKRNEATAVSLSMIAKIAAGSKERKTALEANASAHPAAQYSRSTTSTPQRK